MPESQAVEKLPNDAPRNGYFFGIQGCQLTDARRPNLTYQVVERPLHSKTSASCSDQSGMVKPDRTASAEKCMLNGVSL